ncbi:MAG TPA: DUF523 domain-containing protein [Spirochaetota bacterium]
MIIISACLAGINCTYRGDSNYSPEIASLVEKGKALPVCPEQLGGLTTPREPVEIINGTGGSVLDGQSRIQSARGTDVTDAFVHGAYETLSIAQLCGAHCAILKARSPSCGKGLIHDGTFTGKLIEGNGVTAELLIRNGIDVLTEDEFIARGGF